MVICDGLSTMIKKGIPFQWQYSVDFSHDQLATLSRRFDDASNDRFIKFQSSQAPDVTVSGYLIRIQKHSKCSDACFLLALIYIDRLALNKGLKLTVLNIHRLLITCIMIAAKFHDDLFYNNDFYAKLGGLSLSELNKLEQELLTLLDFSLFVAVPTYNAYANLANRSTRGNCIPLSPTPSSLAHPPSNLSSTSLPSRYNINSTSSTFSSPSTIPVTTAIGEVPRAVELRSADVGVIAPRARHVTYNPNLDLHRHVTDNCNVSQSSNSFMQSQCNAVVANKQVAFPEETCASTHLRPNIWSFDSNWETNDSFSRCPSTSASSFDLHRLESADYLMGSNYPTQTYNTHINPHNNQFYSEQSSLCSTSQSSPSATLTAQMKVPYGPSPPPLLYFKPHRTPTTTARPKDCESAPIRAPMPYQPHASYRQPAAGVAAQFPRSEVYGSRVNGDDWAIASDPRGCRFPPTRNTHLSLHCPGDLHSEEVVHYSSAQSPNNIDFTHRLSSASELKQSSFSPPHLQQQHTHSDGGECFEFSQVYTVPEEPFVLSREWNHMSYSHSRHSNNSSSNGIHGSGLYSTTHSSFREPAARQESYRYHSAGNQQMYSKPQQTEVDRYHHQGPFNGTRCVKSNQIPRCHQMRHDYGAVGDNRQQYPQQQQHCQQRPRYPQQQQQFFNSNVNNNNFFYGQPPMMVVPYY